MYITIFLTRKGEKAAISSRQGKDGLFSTLSAHVHKSPAHVFLCMCMKKVSGNKPPEHAVCEMGKKRTHATIRTVGVILAFQWGKKAMWGYRPIRWKGGNNPAGSTGIFFWFFFTKMFDISKFKCKFGV